MDAKEYYKRLLNYVDIIREKTDFVPEIAIVLGSGLGDFAKNVEVSAEIEYKSLPGFPFSTAPGHDGRFIMGKLEGKNVILMKGRIHHYEGYPMSEVVLPLRVMKLLGAKSVVITNAVGSINTDFPIGSFMAAKDCITSFIESPLIGPNIDELGPRFVDVSEIYDRDLIKATLEIGKENGFTVNQGVYIQLNGPQFETASEIKLYRMLGADACGMSSACEAIAARHMGMRTMQISVITNMGTGITNNKLSGEEVIEVANKVANNFETLIKELVQKM